MLWEQAAFWTPRSPTPSALADPHCRRWREMRQLTTEAEAAAAKGGMPPDAEAALVAVAALDPKTTGAWRRAGPSPL